MQRFYFYLLPPISVRIVVCWSVLLVQLFFIPCFVNDEYCSWAGLIVMSSYGFSGTLFK